MPEPASLALSLTVTGFFDHPVPRVSVELTPVTPPLTEPLTAGGVSSTKVASGKTVVLGYVVGSPSPSWRPVSPPQAHSWPPFVMPKLLLPEAMVAQSKELVALAGLNSETKPPLPSWPRKLPPHAHSSPLVLRGRLSLSP